jgi:polynucleotide 5'-hydroxyl-kinase GRC3/NOL9
MVSTLSYFYSTQLQSSAFLRKWDFSTPLVAVTPYEVILGETIRAVYMIGEGADGILSDDLPLALNGSTVALLEIQHIDPDMPVYEQNRQLPSLDDVNCLGFALIRAVHDPSSDIQNMKIHLTTPLSADSLARINAIAKNGAMELPTPGLMDWRDRGEEAQGVAGVPWGEVPFFDVGTGGVGVERRRWRRNLMRKGM